MKNFEFYTPTKIFFGQGRENAKLLLKSNQDFRNEIETLVREHFGISKDKC